MKKIILTVIILVFGSGFIFLSLYDDGSSEKLVVPQVMAKKKNKEKHVENSKTKVIKQDLQEEEKTKFDQDYKKQSVKETKVDFGSLFRKQEEKEQNQKKLSEAKAKEEQDKREKKEPLAVSAKKPVKRKSPSKIKLIVQKQENPESSQSGGMSFSSRPNDDEVVSKAQIETVSEKGGAMLKTGEIQNFVKMVVYGDVKVLQSAKIEFRLLEPFTIKNKTFLANSILQGTVTSIGQRIMIKVSQVDKFTHPFVVLGNDMEVGVYNTNYVVDNSSVAMETEQNLEEDLVSSSGVNSFGVARELVRGTRNAIKKKSNYKVLLENGTEVYLKY